MKVRIWWMKCLWCVLRQSRTNPLGNHDRTLGSFTSTWCDSTTGRMSLLRLEYLYNTTVSGSCLRSRWDCNNAKKLVPLWHLQRKSEAIIYVLPVISDREPWRGDFIHLTSRLFKYWLWYLNFTLCAEFRHNSGARRRKYFSTTHAADCLLQI